MACFIGKIKSSSLSLNDLHCCSPAEPVTSDLFYGRIKAKLTSYSITGKLFTNEKQVCLFFTKSDVRLEVELKKEREKDSLHIQRLLYISLFVSISTFSPQLPRMYKQTNKQTKGLCAEYSLHGKTSPQWLTCQLTLN